jgi:hypothetical protein
MNQQEILVEKLTHETGCDFKTASMLLNFTGWDYEGAVRIIKALPKDIAVVKVKFVSQRAELYGAIFFCYDTKEIKVKRFKAVLGGDKDLGKIDINLHWPIYEGQLKHYAGERSVEGFNTEHLRKAFHTSEFISKLSKILKPSRSANEEMMNNLLLNEFYTLFADINLAVKSKTEMIDVFELNKEQIETIEDAEEAIEIKDLDEESKEKQDSLWEGIKTNQSLLVLKVDPVLAPVVGTEFRELGSGDEIQVRITDEREIADYLAELLGGKVENVRVPLFSKIVDMKNLEGDSVGVLTQFGPGIMGMFKVPFDVRVVSNKENENIGKPVTQKVKETRPLLAVGGIFLLIILFILLIFVSR